jgi:O-antigen ligase
LDALRRTIYEQPNWFQLSPDFLKRVGSNRIYSCLVYPNALAGAVLLLLPPSLVAVWQVSRRLPILYRGVLTGLLGYMGLACLVWSGSKAGWLIALGMGLLVFLIMPYPRRTKLILLGAILALGLAGFFVRYAPYFKRGATSVSARFDYWRAALLIIRSHPVLGTGPGTFSVPYKQLKDPTSEMARLVHNDYLEQACDSGIPGFLLFSGFVGASLINLYRKRFFNTDSLRFSIWLGLLGSATQGFVEFGLYIPALAWPVFTFYGWLLAVDEDRNRQS